MAGPTVPAPFPTSGTPFAKSGTPFKVGGAPTLTLPGLTQGANAPKVALPSVGTANPLGDLVGTANGQIPSYHSNPYIQAGISAASSSAANALAAQQPSTADNLVAQALALGGTPGTPSHSSSGGSSIVQAGPSLDQIMQMAGITPYVAPSLADLTKQAQAQTNLSLQPKEQAVQQLIDALNSSSANNINNLQATGAAQKSDVQTTFDQLKAFTDAAQQAGLGRYQSELASTNAGNDNTIAGIQSNFAQAQQAAQAEQARLGLQGGVGATGTDNSRLTSDEGFLQGLAQLQKTNAANTIGEQSANYGGTQSMLSQSQQQAGANAQNQISQKLIQAIAAAQQQQQTGLAGYDSQLAGLQGQQGDMNTANLAALQGAQQTAQDNQVKNILAAIGAANAGLKTVSGGSSSTGATPASGFTPQQLIALEMSANTSDLGQQGKTAAQQQAAQQLAVSQQNSNSSTILAQMAAGLITKAQAQAALGVSSGK